MKLMNKLIIPQYQKMNNSKMSKKNKILINKFYKFKINKVNKLNCNKNTIQTMQIIKIIYYL